MNKLKNVKISNFRRRRKKKIENKRCKKKIPFWVLKERQVWNI